MGWILVPFAWTDGRKSGRPTTGRAFFLDWALFVGFDRCRQVPLKEKKSNRCTVQTPTSELLAFSILTFAFCRSNPPLPVSSRLGGTRSF